MADPVNWFGLLALAGLIVGFSLLAWVLVIKPDRLSSTAFADLAQRRGWVVKRIQASLGRGFKVQVTSQHYADWSCEVTRYSQTQTGSTIRTTEFVTGAPLIATGMVVIGPGLAQRDAKMAEHMLAQMGGVMGQFLLQQMLGEDEAAGAADLHLVQSATPGLTIFSTESGPHAALEQRFAQITADWRRSHSAESHFPILIATPHKTRLRLRVDARDPALLEEFVDMGQSFHAAAGVV